MFSVTIIVRVLLRVFDRITGLHPVQVESSSSSIRGGKGEALPGLTELQLYTKTTLLPQTHTVLVIWLGDSVNEYRAKFLPVLERPQL